METLIEKIGIDKLLHFFAGGWITGILTLVVLLQEWIGITPAKVMLTPLIGVICTFVISFMKEAIIDKDFDWKDIIAAMIGSATIYLGTGIGLLFGTASN